MTVENQTKKATATGNSSATTFSFSPMVIFASSDLEVVTTVIATGVETARSEGTGDSAWALSLTTFPATGSITYPEDEVTPIPSTLTITVRRVLTLEQQTNLNNQGGYNAGTQERQFDKLVMLDLQQQEELDRSLKFPASYTGSVSLTVPAPITGLRYLRLNTGLTAMEWVAISTATASASDTVSLAGAIAASAGVASDFARDDHVHPQTHIKGGDLTSANPLVIDTDGRYFDVGGTTNFASMTVAVDRLFVLQFDGILTMTHHATNLNLPGAANITTAAGDRAICQSTLADQVIVVAYIRANGDALNADTLYADVADVLTKGFAGTVFDNGTQTSGTLTPNEANGNLQKAVNGGAHTLAPPSNDTTIVMQYTNNSSAGTLTTSGFTLVDGDTISTTDGDDFFFYITNLGSFSSLAVKALQ